MTPSADRSAERYYLRRHPLFSSGRAERTAVYLFGMNVSKQLLPPEMAWHHFLFWHKGGSLAHQASAF